MPTRPSEFNRISQTIGRLEGKLDGIEEYIHDKRHDDKNVSQKIDGLSQQITREVSRMKAEIQVQLDAIDRRVGTLEIAAAKQTGAKNLAVWCLQSPLVGWIAAGIMLAIAWWKKQ